MNPVWTVGEKGQTVAANFADWHKSLPRQVVPPTDDMRDVVVWVEQTTYNLSRFAVLKYGEDGEMVYNVSADDWKPDLTHDEFVELVSDVNGNVAEWYESIDWDQAMDDDEIEEGDEVYFPLDEVPSLEDIGMNNLDLFLDRYCEYLNDGDSLVIEVEFTSQAEIDEITERDTLKAYRPPA